MSTKQVIVVRMKYPDGKGGMFGIRTGKLAAQVAHASMKVFFDRGTIERSLEKPSESVWFPEETGLIPTPALVVPLTPEMLEWVAGTFTKVVLGVDTEEDLLRVHEAAKAAGLPTSLIKDMGATEFHGVPTNTTCAVGPASAQDIDKITGPVGLVKCRLL